MTHHKRSEKSRPAGPLDTQKDQKAFHPNIATPKDGRKLKPKDTNQKTPKAQTTHSAERSHPQHGGRNQ